MLKLKKEMKLIKNIVFKNILMFSVLSLFLACEENSGPEDITWQLVWEDNFDGAQGQLPDARKWIFDVGGDGWGNNQLEHNTDRAENVQLDGNGNLAIISRKENYAGNAFTSGRIKTKGNFEQAYGRFEGRIKLPYGPGLWPAFWMLGADIDEVPWPQCGEIDIMEYRGQEPTIAHGSIHGPGYSGRFAITKSFHIQNSRFDTDFHLFAIEWGENYIDYFVDDNYYLRITPDDLEGDEWVYDDPFFILLNVAVGGDYVGFPTDETIFPQTMLVDYVKVYRAAN